MLPQEQYDILIDYVESAVCSRGNNGPEEDTIDTKQVAEEAIQAAQCLGQRIDEIFKFTENQTFREYIRERLLMHTCKTILNQQEYSLDELMAITGYSDDKALYKVFRERFGVTPKEIYDEKREDLYKPPRYWSDLSNLEREVVTTEIEVVKEVPVFNTVVKVDRKPYFVVFAVVVLILIALLINRSNRLRSIWEGEYSIYNLTRTVNGEAAPSWEEEQLRISDFGKSVELLRDGEVIEHYKGRIKKSIISWTDTDGTLVEGQLYDDGSIYLFKNEGADCYWLAKPEDLEKWAAIWDGEYDAYSISTDGRKEQTWESVLVFSEGGYIIIGKVLEDAEPYIGQIIYFGPECLIAVFQDPDFGVVKCNITGSDTMDICSEDTNEILRSCIKIDSHNN